MTVEVALLVGRKDEVGFVFVGSNVKSLVDGIFVVEGLIWVGLEVGLIDERIFVGSGVDVIVLT